jgi:hypothetical protein
MQLTKAQREQRAVEDAYRRQSQRLAPKPEYVSPCSSHPSWRVEVTGGRIAPPHAGLCPECAAEEIARRNPAKRPTRKHDPGSAGREADFSYHLWREKHGPVGIEPGSLEELNALLAMAAARAEEEAREVTKGGSRAGRLVSARSEHNRWVEYYAVPGRGIVRVSG